MDLEYVLHVVLYVEIFGFLVHLSLACILGINVLLLLIPRKYAVVHRGDCRDLQKQVRMTSI